MKKTILITGASGFVGRNLVEYLSSKYKLLTPRHSELDLLDDMAVENYFNKNKVDVVIHTAVVGGSRKAERVGDSVKQNIRMFMNLVRNKKRFKKFINLGSGAEYDKKNPIKSVKEEDYDKSIPADDYGFVKYTLSKFIEKEENFVNLRIFGLFGKYEDYDLRFISNAICKAIYDLPITINRNVYFDYIDVNDFARIVEYFIENKSKHRVYNIGRGKRVDIKAVAELVKDISGKKLKIVVRNKGLSNEYSSNNQRLIRELKNFRFTDFRKSVKELYDWYLENKKTINKRLLLVDKE